MAIYRRRDFEHPSPKPIGSCQRRRRTSLFSTLGRSLRGSQSRRRRRRRLVCSHLFGQSRAWLRNLHDFRDAQVSFCPEDELLSGHDGVNRERQIAASASQTRPATTNVWRLRTPALFFDYTFPFTLLDDIHFGLYLSLNCCFRALYLL